MQGFLGSEWFVALVCERVAGLRVFLLAVFTLKTSQFANSQNFHHGPNHFLRHSCAPSSLVSSCRGCVVTRGGRVQAGRSLAPLSHLPSFPFPSFHVPHYRRFLVAFPHAPFCMLHSLSSVIVFIFLRCSSLFLFLSLALRAPL